MNKKKVKILVSVASLVLVVAVMAVGVWAATQVAVNTTVTVGFTATGIQGNCKVYVKYGSATSDAKVGENAMPVEASAGAGATGTQIAVWTLATAQSQTATPTDVTTNASLSFNFADANDDGFIDGSVTFVFVFENTGDYDYTVTPSVTQPTNSEFSVTAGPALTGVTKVEASESGTIEVTFEAANLSASFTGKTAGVNFTIAKVASGS